MDPNRLQIETENLISAIREIDAEYKRALRGYGNADPQGQIMTARQYANRVEMRLRGASYDEVEAQTVKDMKEYENR